jgi:hypothetical protein
MTLVPDKPKVYHITHLRNIEDIARTALLWSDAKRLEHCLDCEMVGMSAIKQRRLEELEVTCHPGTKVGQYVPFYFCPRSIMLYILHRGNHPDLSYGEGQRPIIHLQADLIAAINWAEEHNIRWAFSDRNAGAYYANFYRRVEDLDKINWAAVESSDFREMVVKEGKQAEFLIWESFPWSLVESIGVIDEQIGEQVKSKLSGLKGIHRPVVNVQPSWYY